VNSWVHAPQKCLPRGHEALLLTYYTFPDISSLAILRNVEFDDWFTDGILIWFAESARQMTQGLFLINSFKVFHHVVMIGWAILWSLFIWLVDGCAEEWRLSALTCALSRSVCHRVVSQLFNLFSRMGFFCRLLVWSRLLHFSGSVSQSVSLFSSSYSKVLNASSFRDFVSMRTTILLKILTITTFLKHKCCQGWFAFRLDFVSIILREFLFMQKRIT